MNRLPTMQTYGITVYITIVFFLASTVYSGGNSDATATPSQSDLLNQELLSVVNDLMQPDEDCLLPCFWGFIPGRSSLIDIKDFWTTIIRLPIETTPSEDDVTFASFWTDFLPRNAYTDISFSMTFKGDVLWLLKVSTFNTSIWLEDDWLSLWRVLQEVGNDDIEYYIGVRQGQIVLILLDITSNIMIQKTYSFQANSNMSPDNDTPLQLCPTLDNLIYTSLWLLSDDTSISIEEIIGNPTLPGSKLASYEPIEVMSNLNSEEFSNLIRENPENCLDILSYAKLIELGYGF